MRKRPGGYLGGTTAQFIELGERLAELERQEFESKCLDLAKAMQSAVQAVLPVVEAAVSLFDGDRELYEGGCDCDQCLRFDALERAVDAWRGAQSGAHGI